MTVFVRSADPVRRRILVCLFYCAAVCAVLVHYQAPDLQLFGRIVDTFCLVYFAWRYWRSYRAIRPARRWFQPDRRPDLN